MPYGIESYSVKLSRRSHRTAGMLSPADAFIAVANATAAIVEKAPPYVTYHVRGTFHAAGEGTADRTVTVRTDDGLSIVHDDASGKDELRPPFPASPAFDALSSFTLNGQITISNGKGPHHDGDMRITNVHPLHYESVASRADAVSRSIKGYVVTYADDATPALGHIHLERNAAMHDRKWLRDVWYDPATLLPSRIVWGGENDFTLDTHYQIVADHWLLSTITASEIVHAPFWLGRMSIFISGSYDGYQFSDAAPDPRLLPSPAASATKEP